LQDKFYVRFVINIREGHVCSWDWNGYWNAGNAQITRYWKKLSRID